MLPEGKGQSCLLCSSKQAEAHCSLPVVEGGLHQASFCQSAWPSLRDNVSSVCPRLGLLGVTVST